MRTSGKIFNNTFSAYTEDNKIYGKLEYDIEDHNGDLYHAVIPKIKLPFDADSLDIDRQFCQFDFVRPRCTLSIGGFEFDVLAVPSKDIDPDSKDPNIRAFASWKLIKKAPPKEMTLSEIEKKLGYSVKIVSEAEKEETKDK